MKKTLLILLILLCGCSKAPQDKTKELIRKQLSTTLHDYKSYEPVEFGKLDTSYSSVYDLSIMIDLQAKVEESLKNGNEAVDKMKIYSGMSFYRTNYKIYETLSKKYLDESIAMNNKMDSIARDFRKEFNGWKQTHSFRAKNLAGNLGIHHYVYYFDKDLKKIIKQDDISESTDKK